MIWLMRWLRLGLMEYGKPFGYQRFLDRMPAGQKEKLIENEIAPRAIDREVASSHAYDSYGMFFSSGSTCKTVSPLRPCRWMGRFHDGNRVL